MDSKGKTLISFYTFLQIFCFLTFAGMIIQFSDKIPCIICIDFPNATFYGFVLFITCICGYIFKTYKTSLLNSLQRNVHSFRYLHQLLQQLRTSNPLVLHWINLLLEILYSIIDISTIILVLLNSVLLEAESPEYDFKHISLFLIIMAVKWIFEYYKQYRGSLKFLYITLSILAIYTGLFPSFIWPLFWNVLLCSVVIGVLITAMLMKPQNVPNTNHGSLNTPNRIIEEFNGFQIEGMNSDKMVSQHSAENVPEANIERSLSQENAEVPQQHFNKELELSQKKYMEYELMLYEKDLNALEKEHQNIDADGIKRKRDQAEMENEISYIYKPNNKKSKNQPLILNNQDFDTNSENTSCKQKQTCYNLGFHFESCAQNEINLSFGTSSNYSGAEIYKDWNKRIEENVYLSEKNELSVNSKSKTNKIAEPGIEMQLVREKSNISNLEIMQKNEDMCTVKDLIKFYDSSNKACQMELLVNNDGALDDTYLCKNSKHSEMLKIENVSANFIDVLSDCAGKMNMQTSKNISDTGLKTANENEQVESKTQIYVIDGDCSDEIKTEFRLTHMVKTEDKNANFNSKFNSCTYNAVNAIDSRFIYSVQ